LRRALIWTGYAVFLLALFVVADHLSATKYPDFRVPNHYYHHGLVPNATMLDVWGGRQSTVFTNSLALKDNAHREVSLKSPTHRVAVIGDSMVEGQGIPYADTFPALFEKKVRETGRAIELLNFGVASYSPRLSWAKTKYYLEQVGVTFDELNVFIDPSDAHDEVIYRNIFPVPRNSGENAARWTESYLVRNSLLFQLFGRPKYWYVVHNLVTGLYPEPPRDSRYGQPQDDLTAEESRLMAELEPMLHRVNPGAWWEQMLMFFPSGWNRERFGWFSDAAIMERWGGRGVALEKIYLKRLIRLCRERGITVRLVIYPNGPLINEFDPTAYRAIWSAFAAEQKVPLLDLFPAFQKSGETGDQLFAKYYIPKDVHWNEAGHALMGQAFFDAWSRDQR
jgi:hypothetical protein